MHYVKWNYLTASFSNNDYTINYNSAKAVYTHCNASDYSWELYFFYKTEEICEKNDS